jgi:hypothetical protein
MNVAEEIASGATVVDEAVWNVIRIESGLRSIMDIDERRPSELGERASL